ncbi:MAG: hypothetical protein RL113_1106 [Pseudomonadota bacterium]|jgi:hypothetical protein
MVLPHFYQEIIVFLLLLLGVFALYGILKLHYIFAFGLVKNTSLSAEKKEKIERVKEYIFRLLKVLLFVGLIGMTWFGISVLYSGASLKSTVILWWGMIPEGFWLHLILTLMRIALLIVVMRYVVKKIFVWLDRHKMKVLSSQRYDEIFIEQMYQDLHNGIKYTVVLGIVYRIIHFFPFLAEVSHVFLSVLLGYIIYSLTALGMDLYRLRKKKSL